MYQPEKLKRRRTEIGLRQIDVAEAIGISKQSYFAWEKGITQPNQKNLLKLEKVLEVEPGYFTTDAISVLYQKLTHPNQSKAKTFMEKLLNIMSMRRCLLVVGQQSMAIVIMILSTLTRKSLMILHHGFQEILWNLNILMVP